MDHQRIRDVATMARNARSSDSDFLAAVEDRDATARFNFFYDFAFPRVYRYAQRRMADEAQAQALCRLVFVRAMTSLGGMQGIEVRIDDDEAEFAFWLYCLARRTADRLCDQLAEHPDLLASCDLEGEFEHLTMQILRSTSRKPTSSRRSS